MLLINCWNGTVANSGTLRKQPGGTDRLRPPPPKPRDCHQVQATEAETQLTKRHPHKINRSNGDTQLPPTPIRLSGVVEGTSFLRKRRFRMTGWEPRGRDARGPQSGGKKRGVGSWELERHEESEKEKEPRATETKWGILRRQSFWQISRRYAMSTWWCKKIPSHTDALPQPPVRNEVHFKSPARTWGRTSKGRDPRVPTTFPWGIVLRGWKEIQVTTRWQHRAKYDSHSLL